jgi:xanthine phosphoribosyltransferase
VNDCKILAPQIKKYNPDAIVCVARGGLTLGHFLSEILNIRQIYSLNSIHYDFEKKLDTIKVFNLPNLSDKNRVLLVDDIVDSGETFLTILNILRAKYKNCDFKTVTIFYKTTALIIPDFSIKKTKSWINFFWEADFKNDRYKK